MVWIYLVIISNIIISLGIASIQQVGYEPPRFRSEMKNLYEAKPETIYRGSYCKKCDYQLIPLPPNSKGEFQCMHCQTYYNIKKVG